MEFFRFVAALADLPRGVLPALAKGVVGIVLLSLVVLRPDWLLQWGIERAEPAREMLESVLTDLTTPDATASEVGSMGLGNEQALEAALVLHQS